ncbi:hypothetical protein ACFYRK_31815 [Streptomyces sp. NPDC005381]|uniref:hypothetical protein n=1 Tax=Streptomyces sp. NPDC005381 TaxID=3364714 RepID=UPI0036795A60
MSDFEDAVAAERRRIAAANVLREEKNRSELARWQETRDSVRDLLATAVRSLRAAGAEPIPVLGTRGRRGGRLFIGADRTVIVDRRWPMGRFALDAQAEVYECRRVLRLRETWVSRDGIDQPDLRKSRLRTGLPADQRVMWDEGPLGTWDIPEAVRIGALGCFGHTETGQPLLLPVHSDDDPIPLTQYLAAAVAAYGV